MIKKNLSKLKGIKIFKSPFFEDNRGTLWTSWEKKLLKIQFNNDNVEVQKNESCQTCKKKEIDIIEKEDLETFLNEKVQRACDGTEFII